MRPWREPALISKPAPCLNRRRGDSGGRIPAFSLEKSRKQAGDATTSPALSPAAAAARNRAAAGQAETRCVFARTEPLTAAAYVRQHHQAQNVAAAQRSGVPPPAGGAALKAARLYRRRRRCFAVMAAVVA